MMGERICLYVSDDIGAQLRNAAEKLHCSKSLVVRWAIYEWLDAYLNKVDKVPAVPADPAEPAESEDLPFAAVPPGAAAEDFWDDDSCE